MSVPAIIDLNADLGEGFGVWRLGDDDAMLGEDATYLIHELRPASHQALAYPMEGLDRQLFG